MEYDLGNFCCLSLLNSSCEFFYATYQWKAWASGQCDKFDDIYVILNCLKREKDREREERERGVCV